jgi:hypothetical protein
MTTPITHPLLPSSGLERVARRSTSPLGELMYSRKVRQPGGQRCHTVNPAMGVGMTWASPWPAR